MKKLFIFLSTLTLTISPVQAEESHDHDHDHAAVEARSGRVIHSVDPHLEFRVNDDGTITITALHDEGITDQTVRLVGGKRSNPTRIEFKKDGEVLKSTSKLPEGNNLPIVLMITPAPGAKTVIEKFNLNLSDCPTCSNQEYACTCDHGDGEGGDHTGHDHGDHDGHDH